MYSELFHAVERGSTVLTGSQRLTRSLLGSFGEYQRDKGRPVWRTPRILDWNAWLRGCFEEWTLRAQDPSISLLNAAQEAVLWESIIRDSPEGGTLLRIPETAAQASEAWGLVHAYRLPFNSAIFSSSEDCEAFHGWARTFQARQEANGWIEAARLCDFVADRMRGSEIERPGPLVLAGFDELTPQQRDLIDLMGGASEWRDRIVAGVPVTVARQDSTSEIRSAAQWARQILLRNSQARIGVVVPAIGPLRPKLEQAFQEAVQDAFHVSLGPGLSQHPVPHAALAILELAQGARPFERMGRLLRSPFWSGAEVERTRRALLDAGLRREGLLEPSIEDVRARAVACPILHKTLGELDREIRRLPREQSPSLWSRAFSRLLELGGWPGDQTLDSGEYQAAKAWNKLLSTFATLDPVLGGIALPAALERLRKMAAGKEFQPANEGAPVQILGLWEASGLGFDHLWVMGLHDEELPPAARPNPFLPLALQREHALPHASAERELEVSRKLLARLTSSAPEVVLSYPLWEGDQPRGPSPLIGAPSEPLVQWHADALWPELIRRSAVSEAFEDSSGLPLPADSQAPGGTSILKDMAACPFRAYARHRLGARELEEPPFGMDARTKGTAVHKALEIIWAELKTQAQLKAMPEAELQQLIFDSVETALADFEGLGRMLERQRLLKLLMDWLEIEKARHPFRVLEREKDQFTIAGDLRVSTRIDRVDELIADGRRVIIDYKTGKVKSGAWSGDRPDEPQVPLYCVGADHPIAAAAFAQVRRDEPGFRGVSDHGELGEIRDMKTGKGVALSELIADWRSALDRLGRDFRAGLATVDPKQRTTCDYCKLTALCRVHDARVRSEADDD